ncbi:hypothetical protein D3C71_1423950 [compost metagenome]
MRVYFHDVQIQRLCALAQCLRQVRLIGDTLKLLTIFLRELLGTLLDSQQFAPHLGAFDHPVIPDVNTASNQRFKARRPTHHPVKFNPYLLVQDLLGGKLRHDWVVVAHQIEFHVDSAKLAARTSTGSIPLVHTVGHQVRECAQIAFFIAKQHVRSPSIVW